MLTVKHIRMDGSEFTIPASTVRYEPMAQSAGSNAAVYADVESFTGGTVFVMNDAGKTVARYDLGASPIPLNPSVNGLNCTTKAVL